MASLYGAASALVRRTLVELQMTSLRTLGRRSVVTTLKSGARLSVRLCDPLARQILGRETFEHAIRDRIIGAVRPGMTVVDVGANIGYYAVQFAQRVGARGRVLAFDPNPIMVAELYRNVQLNGLQNVMIRPIALADRTGEVDFHLPPPGHEAHGSLKPNDTFESVSVEKVMARPLDEVLAELQIEAVDVIKIDAEGAERQIFQGARRLLSGERKPLVFFECAELACRPFGHCVLDVLRELADLGYEIEQIDYGNWLATPATAAPALQRL